jgi:hypothetical protein
MPQWRLLPRCVSDRFVVLQQRVMRGSEAVPRLGKAGFDGERCLVAPDRFIVPLERQKRDSQALTRLGEGGMEGQRPFVAKDRLVVAL